MHGPQEFDPIDGAMDRVRDEMNARLSELGKQATLTIADTYATEQMGVHFDRSRRDTIRTERETLIRNLGKASSSWLQFEEALVEVERCVGSLQYMIDPENN